MWSNCSRIDLERHAKDNLYHCLHGKPTIKNSMSHDEQCRVLFGKRSSNCDFIYDANQNAGNQFGHCGFVDGKFTKCMKKDIECGQLHCKWNREWMSYDKLRQQLDLMVLTSIETFT